MARWYKIPAAGMDLRAPHDRAAVRAGERGPPATQLGGPAADHLGVKAAPLSALRIGRRAAALVGVLGMGLVAAGGSATAAEDGAATLDLRVTSAPVRVHAGKGLTYAITVRSTGSAAAFDVRVCDKLPTGVTYVRAFNNGVLRAGTVCWTIGTLAAGQSRKVAVLVRARPTRRVTRLRNTATATAANAPTVSAGVSTYVLRSTVRSAI